jgi:hypothetical protein
LKHGYEQGGQMTEATTMVQKLEELEKKVETVTALVDNLREENQKLKSLLAEKVRELGSASTRPMHTQDFDDQLKRLQDKIIELESRERERAGWDIKRDDIRKRLESVLVRVAKMEEALAESVPSEEGDGDRI